MVPFIAPLLIFLPGYLITLFLPFASGFFKRLAFSIVLSLSAEIALSYLLAVFNPLFLKYFLPFIAIGALILGLIGRKRLLILVEEWRALRSRERLFSGALLALAVAAGIFIFYPHFGYTWPIHADEWWDVSAV
ncbi:hypothetical protein M1432_02060, partial [Patescibacteria group bacterium]|nr:hypothetical protein [Patescibacteria group bacterium]